VVGLALMVFRGYRHERRVTRPMAWVLALLALQVVLGGVTVLLKNVSWTVVVHYGAAALLVGSIALLTVRLTFPTTESAPHDSFSRLIGWFVALSLGLLLAGSTVANTDSHTSCGRGFPLCNEALFPALDHHVVINLTHRIWAPVMLVFALWAVSRSRRDRADSPAIVRAATTVATLFFIEAAIGIDVVVFGQNRAVEVLHSSIASLTWLALMALLSLTWTMPHRGARIEGQGQLSRPGLPRMRARLR